MEIVRFGTPSGRPPLLFLHGSYCGAWIWQPYFLPAFADAGWYGAAISLRGHGMSPGRDRIKTYGVADYLEDVAEGAKVFDRPPVLIGHSMGGYLAQKYALDHEACGMALLSSPSLMGLSGSAQHIALHRPALAVQLGNLVMHGIGHTQLQVIVDAMFNDPESAKAMAPYISMIQAESSRFSFEASWPELRVPFRPVPTFVLGGDADAFVPVTDFLYEAAYWKAEFKILPDASHGLMLDYCWKDAFLSTEAWLKRTFAADEAKFM